MHLPRTHWPLSSGLQRVTAGFLCQGFSALLRLVPVTLSRQAAQWTLFQMRVPQAGPASVWLPHLPIFLPSPRPLGIGDVGSWDSPNSRVPLRRDVVLAAMTPKEALRKYILGRYLLWINVSSTYRVVITTYSISGPLRLSADPKQVASSLLIWSMMSGQQHAPWVPTTNQQSRKCMRALEVDYPALPLASDVTLGILVSSQSLNCKMSMR